MSEHHVQARGMDESEEVFDVIFPSGNESSEVVHPGKEPLYFPAAAIATQRAAVLRFAAAFAAVG